MKSINCTEDQRKLVNHITDAMVGHHLTIADLMVATKLVKRVYKTDAVLKCPEDQPRPLDKTL